MRRISFQSLTLLFLFHDRASSIDDPIDGVSSSDLRPFSSSFHQPTPPLIKGAFKANFNQHKWDQNLSHITSGFIYNSPDNNKVRVDQAFDGSLGSSLFDFANVTDGLVLNKYFLISPSIASKPNCTQYLTNPGFPLIAPDFLTSTKAVFVGEVNDEVNGHVTFWEIQYQGRIPVTVSVGSDGEVTGYDFFAVDLRTRVITKFFNIVLGEVEADVRHDPSSLFQLGLSDTLTAQVFQRAYLGR
ncbi:MAG: hypothetical protein LQ351_004925 [Letrouitia transgressa]|nr:MAG: hypothetical protein LQ351_004925 [Letrouitia transgressa]